LKRLIQKNTWHGKYDLLRDSIILKAIEKAPVPKRYKPEFLKMAGTNKIRDKYIYQKCLDQANALEPIPQKQIKRSRLSTERAAIMRQAIIDGEMNQMVKDSVISMVVCDAFEKVAIPAIAYAAYQAGYPELSGPII